MQLDTTVTLTRSELIELVRKAYPEIKNIREVKIVEDNVREWLKKRTEDESNDWVDVPADWRKPYCPANIHNHELIDVKFRCGEETYSVSPLDYKDSWLQEYSGWDIVKYRLTK